MPDRVEREIEEILERLDHDGKGVGDRTPVSILSHKGKPKQQPPPRTRPAGPSFFARLDPTFFLITGAIMVIAGLVLSSISGALIWAAFAGVVIFLVAFVASFLKAPRPAQGAAPRGHYWRDRYIEYSAGGPSSWEKLKRKFRRR